MQQKVKSAFCRPVTPRKLFMLVCIYVFIWIFINFYKRKLEIFVSNKESLNYGSIRNNWKEHRILDIEECSQYIK